MLAIDPDIEMDEPLAVDLLDHHIVDTGGRGVIHRCLDRHPFRHLVVTSEETGDHRVEVTRLGLGEKSHRAEIESEDGNIVGEGALGCGQDSPVASDGEDEVGLSPSSSTTFPPAEAMAALSFSAKARTTSDRVVPRGRNSLRHLQSDSLVAFVEPE